MNTPASIDRYITPHRLSVYADFAEYEANLRLCKASYIPLSVLEVSLRNAIDDHFSSAVGSDWLENDTFLCRDAVRKRDEAIAKITRRREKLSKDKIIAELNLGFWTGLFTRPYDQVLRFSGLRAIFPALPPKSKAVLNRKILSDKLHTVKLYRNRVFHYEKVIHKSEYAAIDTIVFELLAYLDADIGGFVKRLNGGTIQ